jgi:hypothetical protein
VQYPEAERRELLGYGAAPILDRDAVVRYALGDRSIAEQVLEPFKAARFERIWSDLTGLAMPALGIEILKGPALSRSKLGGLPDLPSGTDWPHRGDKPLAFICQLDLAEVHLHLHDPAVPSAGLLSFFYEADRWTSGSSPEDRGAWRVLLTDGPVSRQRPPALAPATAPPGYDPATWGFDEAGVVFSPRISLPEREHVLVDVFEMSDGEWEAYGALLDELRKAHGPTELRDGHNLPDLTQFLGYPAEIQQDPFTTTQLAAHGLDPSKAVDWESEAVTGLLKARAPWRLLLQVDTISDIGMDWADSGLLYYCIRDEDLAAHRWDDSWLIMESL